MDISESQSFCRFCKKSLSLGDQFYHLTCYNEVTNFNQTSGVELDFSFDQIQLLTILLTVTSLRLSELLVLKINNFDLVNKQIVYLNKIFEISDSQKVEITQIFNRLQISDNLFSIELTYPSKYRLLKSFGLKLSNANFTL